MDYSAAMPKVKTAGASRRSGFTIPDVIQLAFDHHSPTILERSRDDGAYNAAIDPRLPLVKIEVEE
jgi:hypothetical protein